MIACERSSAASWAPASRARIACIPNMFDRPHWLECGKPTLSIKRLLLLVVPADADEYLDTTGVCRADLVLLRGSDGASGNIPLNPALLFKTAWRPSRKYWNP